MAGGLAIMAGCACSEGIAATADVGGETCACVEAEEEDVAPEERAALPPPPPQGDHMFMLLTSTPPHGLVDGAALELPPVAAAFAAFHPDANLHHDIQQQ